MFFCCIKSSLKQVQLLIFVLKELHIFLQIIFSHLLFLMLCIADLIGFDISSLFFWIKTGLYCGFIRGISNRSLIVLIWINGLIIILIFCLIRILVVPEKFLLNIITITLWVHKEAIIVGEILGTCTFKMANTLLIHLCCLPLVLIYISVYLKWSFTLVECIFRSIMMFMILGLLMIILENRVLVNRRNFVQVLMITLIFVCIFTTKNALFRLASLNDLHQLINLLVHNLIHL